MPERTIKRIEDYAHLDIDQMSGKQLAEYGAVVVEAAYDILSIVGSHSMPHADMIRILASGGLGESEIAFGLLYVEHSYKLERVYINNVRIIRLVKENE